VSSKLHAVAGAHWWQETNWASDAFYLYLLKIHHYLLIWNHFIIEALTGEGGFLWGSSNSSGCEGNCFLKCTVMYSDRNLPVFGGICCLCLQSKIVHVLKMDVASPSETSMNFYQSIYMLSHFRRHSPLKLFLVCSYVLYKLVRPRFCYWVLFITKQVSLCGPSDRDTAHPWSEPISMYICMYNVLVYLRLSICRWACSARLVLYFQTSRPIYLSCYKNLFYFNKIKLLLSLEKLAQSMTLALHILNQNLPSHSIFNTCSSHPSWGT
jgi:hypothetical protein